ncbi:MAG: UDP-N-acetylmuramate dehydrogenase [Opitutaceae bacterium]|jgi:UDP-N-acetylmuramate--L-alanine ligase/UDP-N-acetylenolpyruvoylglucosamine reductase
MKPGDSPISPLSRGPFRVHCLGVGGTGVAPLAIYLSESGCAVSGEDDALSEEVGALLGRARVAVGPLPARVDRVVYSSAIPAAHPAYAAAAARGVPLVRRGEMLAEVVRDRKLVAVCGAHGKTTTTAMIVTALRQANFPAGYLVGGLFNDGLAPAGVGSNEWVVAEIDESDGTIGGFSPEITVVTNLDWDHPDHYREPAELEATFSALFARTRMAILASESCPRSQRILASHEKGPLSGRRVFTFGRTGAFASALESEDEKGMTIRLGGLFAPADCRVRARGEFNAANAAAALAAAQLMGVSPDRGALAGYCGIRRRQAVLSADGPTVVEDYAHHPAEIRALLTSLRQRLAGRGRLIAVFQPHRFSRTAQFKAEFASALSLADRVHLLDVYSAGEAPVAGGTAADICAEMQRRAPAVPADHLAGDGAAHLFQALSREVGSDDLVVFVGAGDIDRRAREWLGERRIAAANAKRWDGFAEAVRVGLGRETKLRREEPLAKKTTLGVGGAARLYAEPAGVDDLRRLLELASERNISVHLLGRGSNLIVPDEGVDGLVIALANEAWSRFEVRGGGRVWAGAGLRLKSLCGLAAAAGLAGFEFLEGIPGSVGGALRMNAGAMGGWIFDLVEEVGLMTLKGEAKTLRRQELHADYRHCAELLDAIALGALFKPSGEKAAGEISRQIGIFKRRRRESQPREPSAGCVFKNPPGDSAGRLIDASGLKGERVGDAEISPVHANFIINRGSATGAEVIELIRRVRARVRGLHGVELEPEVMLYGRNWKDEL